MLSQGLAEHLKDQGQWYDSVLALEPTGWTHNKTFKSLSELKPKLKRDRITLYGKAKHKVEKRKGRGLGEDFVVVLLF